MSQDMILMLIKSLGDTLYMVIISAVIATAAGTPLGVILVTTAKGGILENRIINRILGILVNATRSIPFIILMVAIIPLTRMIVGSSIGTNAAIVPMTIAATPFIGRLVETAIKEVEYGVVEAAQAMGATPFQIITRVLLPEAMPTIVSSLTVMVINLIGCSAMAGAIGGGGLGDLAIRYGYQRFQGEVMLATVIVLIVLVQSVQTIGDWLAKKLNKK